MSFKSTVRILTLATLLMTGSVLAQVAAPNAEGVSAGHVHFLVPDPDKHLAIFENFGGKRGSYGRLNYALFPGMFVLFNEGNPEALATETVANHIGFMVNDYDTYKQKLTDAGATFFYDDPETGQILADMPDGYRIEFGLDSEQEQPIVFHHMHLAIAGDLEELRQWYLDVFGAEAGERRGLPSAIVPGGRVDIMSATGGIEPLPSQVGVLNHIGFEVTDMDAFAAKMDGMGIEFTIAPRYVEDIALTIAFITDPQGTYIEITEGFADME